MSEHLQPIYDAWGGNAEAMASSIDELGVTVRQWRNRGDIPSRAWPKIIKAAAERGVVLRLEDFLPAEVKSELPGHEVEDSGDDRSASATKSAEIIGTSDGSADNLAANICDHAQAIDCKGEADSPRPFVPPSSLTCSRTSEPSLPFPASPVCSDGEAEAA